jgi:hypothetical protein
VIDEVQDRPDELLLHFGDFGLLISIARFVQKPNDR